MRETVAVAFWVFVLFLYLRYKARKAAHDEKIREQFAKSEEQNQEDTF